MILLTNELYHHGIKGQKWGVRRFQYADGTLTPAGQKRYNSGQNGKNIGSMKIKEFVNSVRTQVTGIPSEAQNKARAEKYLAEKNAKKKNKLDDIKTQTNIGKSFVDSSVMMNNTIQQANQFAMEQANRAAINASLQAASLSMSGGMNPFMFGMM